MKWAAIVACVYCDNFTEVEILAKIQGGVEIGTGAVIGSGAVVTRSVEPFSIVTGVPAKPMRKRFDTPTITRLLDLQWWHWPHEKLKLCLNDFRNLDINEFIEKHG